MRNLMDRAIANLVGNRLVERSALVTATIKIAGIAILAIAGLIGAATVGDGIAVPASSGPIDMLGLLAATTLCVLAFKGFTTITNSGDEPKELASGTYTGDVTL